jgi:hypothetical protein
MSNPKDDSEAEQFMYDILYGEPNDEKCPSCGMTPTGCNMIGCGVWTMSAPSAAIDNPSDLDRMLDD